MYCKNCGTQMNPNQVICIKCGVKAGDGNAFCANCGAQVNANADYCTNCGAMLNAKNTSAKLGGQDKVTVILLCLFLGALGVHNFMMGENKKGVFKILMNFCVGLGGIFALIDLIKILTDKYVVDPDALV